MSLRDMPMPDNVPRPEMWTPESVVQAVSDGFTFMLPFIHEHIGSPNAYYITGQQYSAFGVTIGPEHTEQIRMTPEGWIEMTLWFPPGMVPDKAFIAPINANGVGQVWALVDPSDIDWDLLNRGHQIRVKGGLRKNPWAEDPFAEPLEKRIRKLCRLSDLSPEEISDALNVPLSWVHTACSGYSRNPTSFDEPEIAAPKIADFMANKMGLGPMEIILQPKYLEQGREHCADSPFTLISDGGGLVSASMTDKLIDFAGSLGYWCEPWDDYELCFMPTDPDKEVAYSKVAKDYQRSIDPACQKQYEQARTLLSRLPERQYGRGGMHQFTRVRMRDFFKDKHGNITREAIIDSQPRSIRELEAAFELIRKFPCVANIWYELD